MKRTTERPVPAAAANQLETGGEAKVLLAAGETTIKMLTPGGLADISTLDRVELRNYVYRVNGRY